MPLTFQPFAETPALNELEKDLEKNVGSNERTFSNALGAILLAASLGRGGLMRWILRLAGGAFLARGITGHCSVYRQLGIDTNAAHHASTQPGDHHLANGHHATTH
jgi:uncharacterized membrane protein